MPQRLLIVLSLLFPAFTPILASEESDFLCTAARDSLLAMGLESINGTDFFDLSPDVYQDGESPINAYALKLNSDCSLSLDINLTERMLSHSFISKLVVKLNKDQIVVNGEYRLNEYRADWLLTHNYRYPKTWDARKIIWYEELKHSVYALKWNLKKEGFIEDSRNKNLYCLSKGDVTIKVLLNQHKIHRIFVSTAILNSKLKFVEGSKSVTDGMSTWSLTFASHKNKTQTILIKRDEASTDNPWIFE